MRKVIINDMQFSMKSEWVDLTLSDFIALCRIEMPAKLIELYKNTGNVEAYDQVLDSIEYEDNIKVFPEYYGKIIAMLSDIPQSIVDLIDYEQRTELFNQYLFPLCFSTVTDIPVCFIDGKTQLYEPPKIETVDYEGSVYLFPKTLSIKDIDIPLSDQPIITFAEASGVMDAWSKLSEYGAEYAALIPAIYLRKEGELYDENTVKQRAETFKNLPMDIVWALFFYTMQLAQQSLINTLQFTTEAEQSQKKQLQIKVE